MQSKNQLKKNLESKLSAIENPVGEGFLLNQEEVAKIMVDFDDEMLKEYNSWFHKTEELAEWLGLLFKRNEKHIAFPALAEIEKYRTRLPKNLRQLPSREVTELMEFFTTNQIYKF